MSAGLNRRMSGTRTESSRVSRFLMPARPGPTPDVTRTGDTRLRGKGLLTVRLGWATVAALCVGLFAAGVPSEFALLQTPCPTPICTTGQLPPAALQSLTDLGLTPAFYAAATVGMDILFAAAYASVAALIFWRRSRDRVAVFASLALLIFGTATFGFTLSALAADHPGWQTPVALLHFLGAACFGLFLYVFPDGRFVPRWSRRRCRRVDRLAAGRAHLSGLDHPPGRLADPCRDLGLAGRAGHGDLCPDSSLPAPGEPTATATDQVGGVRDLGGVRRVSRTRPGPERCGRLAGTHDARFGARLPPRLHLRVVPGHAARTADHRHRDAAPPSLRCRPRHQAHSGLWSPHRLRHRSLCTRRGLPGNACADPRELRGIAAGRGSDCPGVRSAAQPPAASRQPSDVRAARRALRGCIPPGSAPGIHPHPRRRAPRRRPDGEGGAETALCRH